jgi:phage terminase large subunit GpA-like protein
MMKINVLEGFAAGLRPIPLMTISEWADRNRMLSSESSAEPGPWRTSRTPYLREIQDNLSPNSPVQEVIAAKGVQLGFTEGGLNVVGCYIDIAPCPIMYVMPTIEMSKGISESRIDPMIDFSPSLKKRVKPSRSRDSGNTKFTKRYPGGVLVLSGANSAASLRSRPVKVLVLDEVDAYPLSVDNEGSPIALAEKRTSTFGSKRKIYKLSTPTIDGQSVITSEYEDSDQRKYYVPCPHCDHKQELIFENLKWTEKDYSSVLYFCEECGTGIEERYKPRMLEGGEWIATAPEKSSPYRKGYHINSLYSPLGWLGWAQIAEQWEKAQNDVNLMRVFVNTILGETYKDKGEAPPWENLYNRREPYQINRPPVEVQFITAGVDVQRDRLELEIVGWCKGKRSFSIDFRVLLGDTSARAVWDQLAEVVSETWVREDGAHLTLRLMAVDSGYNTQEVYAFCRRFDITRVIPVKGQESQQNMVSPPRQVDVTAAGKKIGKTKVYHVGISLIKSELYGFLRQDRDEHGNIPYGFCHFPQYDQHYFRGLTAEQLQMKTNKRGYRVYEWVKKYDRNEPLDCRVYARAAAAVVGIDRHENNEAFWSSMKQEERTPAKSSRDKSGVDRRNRTGFW